MRAYPGFLIVISDHYLWPMFTCKFGHALTLLLPFFLKLALLLPLKLEEWIFGLFRRIVIVLVPGACYLLPGSMAGCGGELGEYYMDWWSSHGPGVGGGGGFGQNWNPSTPPPTHCGIQSGSLFGVFICSGVSVITADYTRSGKNQKDQPFWFYFWCSLQWR